MFDVEPINAINLIIGMMQIDRDRLYVRQDFFLGRTCRSLEDLNRQFDQWRDEVADARRHATTRRIADGHRMAPPPPNSQTPRDPPPEPVRAKGSQVPRRPLDVYAEAGRRLAEEYTGREGRRVKAALQMARLTTVKTLADFDVSFQPSLDRNRILTLAQLEFIDRHEVLHLLGPPGIGKSHLALALGVEAVKAGRSVSFATLAEIVDEIGYLPVIPGGGNLFFQLVNARYERGAMILTSNRGFAEWGDVFGDPVVATALLDRLLHHAVVIQIEVASYRLRQHAGLIPENTLARPSTSPSPTVPKRRGRQPKNRSPDQQPNT